VLLLLLALLKYELADEIAALFVAVLPFMAAAAAAASSGLMLELVKWFIKSIEAAVAFTGAVDDDEDEEEEEEEDDDDDDDDKEHGERDGIFDCLV
jgi:hypothetical protein